jgi:phage shock protein A
MMGLLDRVGTLVRANLNDLLDKAEEPEKMLKQVILDMQNQLMQVKTQVAIAMADEHLLRKQLAENRAAEADYLARAEAAMRKSREDLARASVERALSHKQMTASFAEQLADQSLQVENLKAALLNLEAKLAEARTRSELLMARDRRARAVSRATQARAAAAGDVRSSTFDRMSDKVNRKEAVASARSELERDDLDHNLVALGREDEVNRILGEMRAKKPMA